MVVYLRDALDRKLAAGRAATTRPLRIRLPVRIAAASLAMRSIARLYLHRETFSMRRSGSSRSPHEQHTVFRVGHCLGLALHVGTGLYG